MDLTQKTRQIRVLYSFPMKLGGPRICTTAWQQVYWAAAAGAQTLVFPGVLSTPLPPSIAVRPTLARGRLRISYKLAGRLRAYALHDYIVARRLPSLVGKIDIIHVWPLAALRTMKVAKCHGIPTVYERPNTHTGFFYERVQQECAHLGIELPPRHEHAYNSEVMRIEEEEYQLADRLLCPSEFVARTFLERGFAPGKLARHQYGFDEQKFYPLVEKRRYEGLTILFAGTVAPVKGLHYALEAWLRSPAHQRGTFLIAGSTTPGYVQKIAPMLRDPSIQLLGHRNDIPELMRTSDVFILPSIAEGYPLVIAEARGSGCVPLVSDACCEICRHMETGLVHRVGDIDTLAQQITMLDQDCTLLEKLRRASLGAIHEITWKAAGIRLLEVYREVIGEQLPAASNAARQTAEALA